MSSVSGLKANPHKATLSFHIAFIVIHEFFKQDIFLFFIHSSTFSALLIVTVLFGCLINALHLGKQCPITATWNKNITI